MAIVDLSGTDWIAITDGYVRGGDVTLEGLDEIDVRDSGGLTKEFTATDSLTFTDLAVRVGGGAYGDVLDITDSGVVLDVKERTDTLTITDSGSPAGSIRTLVGSDLLDIEDGGYGASSTYHPCYEPYDVEPPLGYANQFVLTYPYVSPTDTVILRVPSFGNTDVSETGTVIRRTISNQLSVARGATWPVIRKLKFSFTALPQAQRDAFLDFCTLSSGFEIGILDQENRQWHGVITGKIESNQVGPGCDYATSFEFQGKLA